MRRRTVLRAVAATTAGAAVGRTDVGPFRTGAAAAGTDCDDADRIRRVEFYSTASQVDPTYGALTDEATVVVAAERTASNDDADGNGDAYSYGDDTPIPLVSRDGGVFGFGAMLVTDDNVKFDYGNEELVLNAWDDAMGGSGTVLYDEGHGQYYTLSEFSEFETYAEDNGYSVRATTSLADDLANADGAVVTSPGEAFTGSDLDAVASFVADGGALFLHDQSDYNDYDGTGVLNDIADRLSLAFRFNDDEVTDADTNDDGDEYAPLTDRFNVDDHAVFTDRSGLGFEAGNRYEATVTGVSDGDTVDVEFPDGSTAEIRTLGHDTPETRRNGTYESIQEWEGIEDDKHLSEWGENAKDYATAELDGETVEIAVDEEEAIWDSFGRLLAYVHYDQDGDGAIDTNYNRDVVRQGYARVYGSSLTEHESFWDAEADARSNGRRVWSPSDPENTSEVRDRSVESVFVPNVSSVRTSDGAIAGSRVPVYAESTATQSLDGGVDYADIPVVGVDDASRVALVGGLSVNEEYHADVSDREHEPFLTNLLDSLAGRTGSVLVDGGHRQFNESWALSNEDLVYYQRYLEGQGLACEQVNTLSSSNLSRGRAIVVTPPAECFTATEVDTLRAFRDDGGAILLVGSADASERARRNLDDLADSLGSDLRLNADQVYDDSNNVNDDPALLTTGRFNDTDFALFGPYS
jgi:endonuclease YncB( thermonuclease family)